MMAETLLAEREDPKQYEALEAAVSAEFRPRSALERQLIARLVSLLWRLRRATSIETGLFEYQGRALHERRKQLQVPEKRLAVLYKFLDQASAVKHAVPNHSEYANQTVDMIQRTSPNQRTTPDPLLDTSLAFARVCNVNRGVFDRLGRYELALQKHLLQILMVIERRPRKVNQRDRAPVRSNTT